MSVSHWHSTAKFLFLLTVLYLHLLFQHGKPSLIILVQYLFSHQLLNCQSGNKQSNLLIIDCTNNSISKSLMAICEAIQEAVSLTGLLDRWIVLWFNCWRCWPSSINISAKWQAKTCYIDTPVAPEWHFLVANQIEELPDQKDCAEPGFSQMISVHWRKDKSNILFSSYDILTERKFSFWAAVWVWTWAR